MEAIDLRRTSLLWRRLWLRWFAPSVIPEPVRRVLVGIEEAGGEAVVVGGCVRDLLMGGIPEDWDVATSIAPQRVQEIFPRTVPTGIAHGTVTVLSGDYGVEVTTYRAEGEYTDRRRPDWVAFSKDLKEDLARRDFTFNAMALTRTGLLMDPFGGLEDLARRRIVTVGRARDRFGEDALRMVRAVRFAAQLDVDLDPEIVDACSEMSQFLDAVSRERIRLELDRILMSSNAARGMELLQSTGLLKRFWPELAEGPADQGERMAQVAGWLADRDGSVLVFVRDKRTTVQMAHAIAEITDLPPAERTAEQLAAMEETRATGILRELALSGVAFHCADLRFNEREVVETGFAHGDLSVLVCT
ncbi:MAG: hypothetical protein ACOCVQ_01935, partial [Bacillota bacterium]